MPLMTGRATMNAQILSCVGILICASQIAAAQDLSPPTLAVASYGFDAGGWRVDRHPRLLADVNGDGRADIVGFGNAGAYVSLGQANGQFSNPVLAVGNYGYDAGGWRVNQHPRLLGDVNGDGRADIVGFGNAGAYVSLGQANGQFASPVLAVASYGYDAGGWRVGVHPRLLGDVNGDGRADIIGFGNAGVYVSLGQSNGTFSNPVLAVASYGAAAGGWLEERHPRLLGDVNGDGRVDIVGFGNAGAYVSLGQANGTFAAPVLAVASYGYDAGGWRVERHPRLLGDVNGDGRADIVGFGNAGAYVSLGQPNGTFAAPVLAVATFGYDAGGWRVERHPRLLGDVNGDGRADIVGFGNAGVYVSLGLSNGQFTSPVLGVASYGYDAGGWRIERHPRLLGNVNGDRSVNGRELVDVVGFGNAGAYVSLSGQPTPHNLNVSRFISSVLTNADADRILADASAILQAGDGATDVACNVALTRAGNVGTFNIVNGIVNSQADFNAIVGLPGDVKIINAINWCGGPGTGIIGCAPTPGGSFAAVRFTANLEGILWAHEFGHNQSLPHRNGNNLVMNPFITATARQVDATECGAYRNPTPATAEAFVVSAGEAGDENALLTGAMAAAQSDPSVDEFVRRFYVHGVPYNEARKFGPNEIPKLLQMLRDPNEKPYWQNIVGVLGIVGDETVAQSLTDFIESNRGKALDPETYRAALNAPIALGYLANRTSERALNYLTTTAEGLASASPATAEAAGELRLDPATIGQSAVLGLALSGRPQARQVLERLMQSETQRLAPEITPTNAPSQNLLAEALTTLKTVEERGLSDYYKRREH